MTGLPRIPGREAAKAFGKMGYEVDRQRGSHMIAFGIGLSRIAGLGSLSTGNWRRVPCES